MALGRVLVKGEENRDVYINGFFLMPQGKTNHSFLVNFGETTFSTLTPDWAVDFEVSVIVNSDVEVEAQLLPVDPPRPIPGHQASAAAAAARVLAALPPPPPPKPPARRRSRTPPETPATPRKPRSPRK